MEARKRYVAEFVYGAIDGTVTTFAVVSGAVGAALAPSIVLILGFANLLADGFSMAASNYLSTRSQRDLDVSEGVARDGGKEPIKTALATFISFVVVGFIPLLPFVIASLHLWIDNNKFWISLAMTGIAFLIVGAEKGLITKTSRAKSALLTLAIGAVASAIAFLVGYLLRGLA